MIQHIVLAKWKPSADENKKTYAKQRLNELPKLIPGIVSYSAGDQCSPEGLGKGLQFGFVMTFRDAAARDAYLPHPEHKKVVEDLLPLVDDVLVYDYEFN